MEKDTFPSFDPDNYSSKNEGDIRQEKKDAEQAIRLLNWETNTAAGKGFLIRLKELTEGLAGVLSSR